MVKYRKLNNKELEELEADFVKFLSSQSIIAPDWQAIKSNDKERMNSLIDLFSDIVMEKVLDQIDFVEMLGENEIRVFAFHETKARLVGLKLLKKGPNLSDENQLSVFLGDVNQLLQYQPQVYELEKKYTKSKAEEVFFLMNSGAKATDDKLYLYIDNLIKAKG